MVCISLHTVRRHPAPRQVANHLIAQRVDTHTAGHHRLTANGTQKIVDVTRHIERRPAEHLAARQHIPQGFAEADNCQWIAHRTNSFWAQTWYREVTDLNQGLAFQNPFELVHSKELRSCGGRIRKRFNRRRFGIDAKMLFPAVETRIEKPNQPIGPRDERGDVSAFGAVAEGTIVMHTRLTVIDPLPSIQ
jgi:hypothetical protein